MLDKLTWIRVSQPLNERRPVFQQSNLLNTLLSTSSQKFLLRLPPKASYVIHQYSSVPPMTSDNSLNISSSMLTPITPIFARFTYKLETNSKICTTMRVLEI